MLLEMLIAIVIFALVAASISIIFNQSLSVYRFSTDKNSAVQEAQTAMEWLLRDIERAGDIAQNAQSSDITLDPTTRNIRYYRNAINQTMFREDPVNGSQLLAEGVTAFSLAYYRQDNTNIPPPISATEIQNIRVVEINISTEKNNKNFDLYSIARFEYNPITSTGAGLPKTGQETSYATNDDADYADPASEDVGQTRGEGTWAGWNADGGRFTNNGDGTITDNATGLMWVANPTAAGVGGTYTWANAITACENLNYAGHTDWRLPNIKELMSIVDYEAYNPTIDQNFFTCQSYYYWSSSTDVSSAHPGGTWAWLVSFSSGLAQTGVKTGATYVRPVRGGQ